MSTKYDIIFQNSSLKRYRQNKNAGTRLTIIAHILGRAVHRTVREHLQVSVLDEHFDFPGRARDVRQVCRRPAIPAHGGHTIVPGVSPAGRPFRGHRDGVQRPVPGRRAQHRAAARQNIIQHQQADYHQYVPPITAATALAADAAAAVAAIHVRPLLHHIFMPFPGGTGQGTVASTGSVAPDTGARLAAGRPHTDGLLL